MVRPAGFEPASPRLKGEHPGPLDEGRFGAGSENRTHTSWLEAKHAPPRPIMEPQPCGCCAALTPLVVGARCSLPAPMPSLPAKRITAWMAASLGYARTSRSAVLLHRSEPPGSA